MALLCPQFYAGSIGKVGTGLLGLMMGVEVFTENVL